MRSLYHRIRVCSFAALAVLVVGCARPDVLQRALAYSHQHDDPKAIELLRAHLRTHPGELPPRRLLIRLLAASSDVPAALREVDELGRHLPKGDPSADLERGHVLELAHRFDEALAAYDAAADAAPTDPRGPREGGLRSAHWGEAEEALPRLEEAERRGAHDAELWHVLGAVRASLGDTAGAFEAYRRVELADPQRIEGRIGLATLALAGRDHAAALVQYDELAKRKPRDATFALARAYCLARLGRRREAQAALFHAEELGAPRGNVAKIQTLLGPRPPE